MHEHKTVILRCPPGVEYRIMFCLDCGTVMEDFGGGSFASLTPEWSKSRLEGEIKDGGEKFTYISEEKLPVQRRRLGRGLKEIQKQAQTPKFLQDITNGIQNEQKDR